MKVRRTLFAVGLAMVVATALPLRAQTGCDDSPEDPTIVLALLGGAGAIATSMMRFRGRKQ